MRINTKEQSVHLSNAEVGNLLALSSLTVQMKKGISGIWTAVKIKTGPEEKNIIKLGNALSASFNEFDLNTLNLERTVKRKVKVGNNKETEYTFIIDCDVANTGIYE